VADDVRIEMYLKMRQGVLFFWQWYLTGLGLACGWALSAREPWSLYQKIGVTIIVASYVGMNISALSRAYRLLFAAHKDLKEIDSTHPDHPHLHEVLRSLTYNRFLLGLIYAAGLLVTLFFIWNAGGPSQASLKGP